MASQQDSCLVAASAHRVKMESETISPYRCAAVCPPDNVITIDDDGYPHVDFDGCIDCHLCLDLCPMDDMDIPELYRNYLGVPSRWSSMTTSVRSSMPRSPTRPIPRSAIAAAAAEWAWH